MTDVLRFLVGLLCALSFSSFLDQLRLVFERALDLSFSVWGRDCLSPTADAQWRRDMSEGKRLSTWCKDDTKEAFAILDRGQVKGMTDASRAVGGQRRVRHVGTAQMRVCEELQSSALIQV